MKKIIYLIFILIFVTPITFACTNDFQCGIGMQCIQPEGAVNQFQGICVKPTNNGIPEPYVPDGSIEPHQVKGCSFDVDCDIGYYCIKRPGEMDGVCVK